MTAGTWLCADVRASPNLGRSYLLDSGVFSAQCGQRETQPAGACQVCLDRVSPRHASKPRPVFCRSAWTQWSPPCDGEDRSARFFTARKVLEAATLSMRRRALSLGGDLPLLSAYSVTVGRSSQKDPYFWGPDRCQASCRPSSARYSECLSVSHQFLFNYTEI